MLPIARRNAHYVFAFLQSGLTTLIASGIASVPLLAAGEFLLNWGRSWLTAWLLVLPIVIFAAPFIRRASEMLTKPSG